MRIAGAVRYDWAVKATSNDIYEAVVALSRSIAGHTDLESLLKGVAESLRRVVRYDYVGLALHEAKTGTMEGHILTAPGNPPITTFSLPVDQDPAGWVWLNQQPLVLSLAEETRWPNYVTPARKVGIGTTVLVPLTAGDNRLGAFGFSSAAQYDPDPAELAFLERVAIEFAVAVEAFFAKQTALRERDRLRTLFDITNALVSKLSLDELFGTISDQLDKVVRHDYASIAFVDKEGGLNQQALHFPSRRVFFEPDKQMHDLTGMPALEVLESRKPLVVRASDLDRYPSPDLRRYVDAGFRSACLIPLISPNRTLGSVLLGRTTDEEWAADDIDFLMQVASQIAIAMENSLAYRELSEMKDRLATEKLYLEDEIRVDQNVGNMIGSGPAFQSILKSIHIVAPTDSTVLILGETGTGKELVARAIHDLSNRARGSFVKVNCAAIPSSLLESELFGHEKGSFTGAVAQKIGRFELAHQGTLFLDEIGEMPLELQPKLLRAIQDQEFERVGGNRTIRTNVRFIAATNRDLKRMVEENRFRADLYYRLHVFPLEVPPLRERRDDIALLTRYFVQKHAHRMGRKIESIPNAALEALIYYDWPGNIRELQNVIERSVILSNGPELRVAMPEVASNAALVPAHDRGSGLSEAAERARILQALKDAQGQVGGPDGAAARLGLKRTTLQSRMRKYNIARSFG